MSPSPGYGPSTTIGVLGAGQLGRMFAMAAVRMGFDVHVFAPDAQGSPASAVTTQWTAGDWDDEDALRAFASACDVVTLEFENVPLSAVDVVERYAPVRPGREVLRVTQDRQLEKAFLQRHGIPVAPWWPVRNEQELRHAVSELKGAGILKTARLGYDGKGQQAIAPNVEQALMAWQDLGAVECVLEERIPLATEVAVVVARNGAGEMQTHPVIETTHVNGILDVAQAPANLSEALERQVVEAARAMAEGLSLWGVACLECFISSDGRVLANEIAPRPHNSAHLTIEACSVSQFEQHVRAVADYPLAVASLHRPAAMSNVLGEHMPTDQHAREAWKRALGVPGVAVHLYGKAEARTGRKMGHLTALDADQEVAKERVIKARAALAMRGEPDRDG